MFAARWPPARRGGEALVHLVDVAVAGLCGPASLQYREAFLQLLALGANLFEVAHGGKVGNGEECALGPELLHEVAVQVFRRTGDSSHLGTLGRRLVKLLKYVELLGRQETHLDTVSTLVVEATAQPLAQCGGGFLEAHPGDVLRIDVTDLNIRLLVELLVDASHAERSELDIDILAELGLLDHVDVLVEVLGHKRADAHSKHLGMVLAQEGRQLGEEEIHQLLVFPVECGAIVHEATLEELLPRLEEQQPGSDDLLRVLRWPVNYAHVLHLVPVSLASKAILGHLGDELAFDGAHECCIGIGSQTYKSHGLSLGGFAPKLDFFAPLREFSLQMFCQWPDLFWIAEQVLWCSVRSRPGRLRGRYRMEEYMAYDEDRPDANSDSVSSDSTTTDSAPGDSTPATTSTGLTPEDIAYMEAVQKKRVKFMIVAGIIIMILGFFAGKNMAQSKDDSQAIEFPAHSIVLDAGHAYDQQVYGVDREEVHL